MTAPPKTAERSPRRPPARRPRRRRRGLTAPPHIDALDGLRLAAVVVATVSAVFAAFLGPANAVGALGAPAILTLLVVSGFLAARPVAFAAAERRQAPDVARSWWRRAVRIYPLWWTVCLVAVATDGVGAMHGFGDWALVLGLVQVFDPTLREAIVAPGWAASVLVVGVVAVPAILTVATSVARSVAPKTPPVRVIRWTAAAIAVVLLSIGSARVFAPLAIGAFFASSEVTVRFAHRRSTALTWLRSPVVLTASTAVGWIVLAVLAEQQRGAVDTIADDPARAAVWLLLSVVWFVPAAFGDRANPVVRVLSSPRLRRPEALMLGVFLWHAMVIRWVDDLLGADAHLLAASYLVGLGAIGLAIVSRTVLQQPLAAGMAATAPQPAGQASPASDGPVPVAARTATTAPAPLRSIPQIEGLRVLAAVGVVVFHVASEASNSAQAVRVIGALVIPLFTVFFTVSGFVLYRPWATAHRRAATGESVDARSVDGGILRFIFRRACRIYPLYWVAQAATFAHDGETGLHGIGEWLQMAALFPLPNYRVVLNHGLGVIVWTLIAEMTYYILLPFFGRGVLALIRRGMTFRNAQLATVGTLLVTLTVVASITYGFAAVFPCIAIGMGLAAIDTWQRAERRWLPALKVAAGATWAVLPIVGGLWALGIAQTSHLALDEVFDPNFRGRLPAMLLTSTVLFVPAVFGPGRSWYRRALGNRTMRFLGALTYGVYLLHFPVMRILTEQADLSVVPLAVLTLAIATPVAWATFHLVETPSNRFGRRGFTGATQRSRETA